MSIVINDVRAYNGEGSVVRVQGGGSVSISNVYGQNVENVLDLDNRLSGNIETIRGRDVRGDVIRIVENASHGPQQLCLAMEDLENPEFQAALRALVDTLRGAESQVQAEQIAMTTMVGKFLKKQVGQAWSGLISNLWRIGWESI